MEGGELVPDRDCRRSPGCSSSNLACKFPEGSRNSRSCSSGDRRANQRRHCYPVFVELVGQLPRKWSRYEDLDMTGQFPREHPVVQFPCLDSHLVVRSMNGWQAQLGEVTALTRLDDEFADVECDPVASDIVMSLFSSHARSSADGLARRAANDAVMEMQESAGLIWLFCGISPAILQTARSHGSRASFGFSARQWLLQKSTDVHYRHCYANLHSHLAHSVMFLARHCRYARGSLSELS